MNERRIAPTRSRIRVRVVRVLGVAVVALVAAHCSSLRPHESASAQAAPAESGAPATLYLYRLAASPQIGITVRVNGASAGRLRTDSYFRWELPPGDYVFTARSQTNVATRRLRVEPGGTYYLEQSIVLDLQFRRVKLNVRDEARGAAAVRSLSQSKSSYDPASPQVPTS